MYYVYVIQSKKDNQFYTGFTRDLENRIREHNAGRVPSTKERGPFELVYYEVWRSIGASGSHLHMS